MLKIGSEPDGARIKTIYEFDNILTRNDAVNLIIKICKRIPLGCKTIEAKNGDIIYKSDTYDFADCPPEKIINTCAEINIDSITVSGLFKGYTTSFEMNLKTKELGIICFESRIMHSVPELERIIESL